MAITYPISPPSPFLASRLSFTGISSVSRNTSPFTMQTQQYNWPGQAWLASVDCPPMPRADAEAVISFLLAAHRGTFYFQDYANPTNRGGVTGTLTVATATANSTTLTYTNTGGSGSFALGDWIQISTSLYKIIKVDGTTLDLFPVLRSSYAGGTSIIYGKPNDAARAQGVFRLASGSTEWSIDLASIYGVNFSIIEDVAT